MTNMAGNAFSVFHYGPVHCALVAAVGKYGYFNDADVSSSDEEAHKAIASTQTSNPTDTDQGSSQ